MTEIVFATNNEHKLRELREMLGSKIRLLSLNDLSILVEIPEDHETLNENALQKAMFIKEMTGLPCIADDTGLEVDALGGEPGVYSARYSGMPEDFPNKESLTIANMRKLLQKLEGRIDRDARFRTVIALVEGNEHFFFEGIVEGTIIHEERGTKGFGYDPIFKPVGHNFTFAEMDGEMKNQISHRGRAVEKLVNFLNKRI
jgi:XTP/dITP diphosphohydrolase